RAAEQSGGSVKDALAIRGKQWGLLLADAAGNGYYAAAPKGSQWWELWQLACEEAGEALYGSVFRASRGETELANGTKPDIVVAGDCIKTDRNGHILHSPLIIDAKVGRYYDDPPWLDYVDHCDKLEIWWLSMGRSEQDGDSSKPSPHFLGALSIAIADLLADGKSTVDSWRASIDPQELALVREFLEMCDVSPDELPIQREWAERGYSDPVVQQVIAASR
ncbi:MAG: hypothetical protein AAB393_19760, partial [Bacteroidota bacterium]